MKIVIQRTRENTAKYFVIFIIFAPVVFFTGCNLEKDDAIQEEVETKENIENQEDDDVIQEEMKGNIEGLVALENVPQSSGVKIYLTGTVFTATTQNNGSFQILNVPADTYKIVVEKEGFVSVEQEVEVAAGQVTRVEFVLEREIPMPPPLPNP